MKFSRLLKTAHNEKGMVLVIAIILLSVLVVVGFTAAIMTSTDSKISSNYRENQRALYNAEAGVETVLAHLRSTTVTYPTAIADANTTCPSAACTQIYVTPPSGFTSTNFFGHTSGSNTVNIYGKVPANKLYYFRMTGTGANNASKTIEVHIKKSVAAADGAVAMYGGGPAVDFKTGAGGGYAVDGHDYPVPASSTCNGNACDTSPTALPAVPGLFTVMSPTITGDVSAHLGGDPPQDIGESREAAYNSFVNAVLTNGTYQATLGTRTDPRITVIPNGTTLNGTGNGAGVIIVDNGGSLNIVGNFEYEGLVILRGTGRVFGAGTANIFGSLVTIGHTAKLIDLTGGVNLFYSSAALNNIAGLANIGLIEVVLRVAWQDA